MKKIILRAIQEIPYIQRLVSERDAYKIRCAELKSERDALQVDCKRYRDERDKYINEIYELNKSIKLNNPEGYQFSIYVDYPVGTTPRWTVEEPHKKLLNMIYENKKHIFGQINVLRKYRDDYAKIKLRCSDTNDECEPYWINEWFPPLDAMGLFSILAEHNPKIYLEIGSGNSTKFARRVVEEKGLRTKIISIDPQPRAQIDNLCDKLIRNSLESVDIGIFHSLQSGDVLFVDNSHRVFMNSDVTVFFLEVIPILAPGVFVHFHDICLPSDYPREWGKRYFSEQYLLGTYLLSKNPSPKIILPNHFIWTNQEWAELISDIWDYPNMQHVSRNGCSFWIVIK